ncbi:hypothetical protein L1987_85871 [Smallanthus sonchifolius]|uniref:Uncharacterized protein n=1 Tax=Smallanthus sonchifolius TaxID=185202 RepID=A0ACB8XYI9_9ASTR|nr:hypothetical protein L1987_85871 [Smallanthus sonchifolius]
MTNWSTILSRFLRLWCGIAWIATGQTSDRAITLLRAKLLNLLNWLLQEATQKKELKRYWKYLWQRDPFVLSHPLVKRVLRPNIEAAAEGFDLIAWTLRDDGLLWLSLVVKRCRLARLLRMLVLV